MLDFSWLLEKLPISHNFVRGFFRFDSEKAFIVFGACFSWFQLMSESSKNQFMLCLKPYNSSNTLFDIPGFLKPLLCTLPFEQNLKQISRCILNISRWLSFLVSILATIIEWNCFFSTQSAYMLQTRPSYLFSICPSKIRARTQSIYDEL